MSANISSADYAAYMARRSSTPTPARRAKRGTGETAVRKANAAARLPRVLALLGTESLAEGVCVKATQGKPNAWEYEWGMMLLARRRAREICDFAFEPIRLRLAPGVYYSPDWVWLEPDGQVWCCEVKGRRRRIEAYKIAVDRFPLFRFKLVGKRDGVWRELRVYGRGQSTTEKE